jgi:oligoribonuclease
LDEKTMTTTSTPAPANERTCTPAYIWFDTEFTGLDTDSAHLLQVAMIITDVNLQRLTPPDRDVCLCIKLPPDAPVSPWVAENLAGLLARCRSQSAVSVAEADHVLAQRLDEALGPVAKDIKRRPILAGNTIHMDMAMARRFLPEFNRRLHYRMLDVSTLKIFWNDSFTGPVFDKEDTGCIQPCLPTGFAAPAAAAHDAYYDIHASLAEMNYYRRQFGAREA